MPADRPEEAPRSMLWFARDLPNLVSLAGLFSAIAGVYFAILGAFPLAMIGLVWAIVFDWLDGRVARGMSARTDDQRAFGAHMDSLIDVVSFGVMPAVVLLSIGRYSPWFLPGAFLVLGAGVVRLSYFNTFGLVGGSTYRGLALDNNALLLVLLFAVRPLVPEPVFVVVLYAGLIGLAALNVAPIRTPKLGGNWFFAVVAYAVAVSVVFALQMR